jgi:hypothetical protein
VPKSAGSLKESKSPKITSPKATSPKVTSPKATSPKATSPKATSPKVTSPKAASPLSPNGDKKRKNDESDAEHKTRIKGNQSPIKK